MCLAVPGKVESIYEAHETRMGKVNFGGVVKEVCFACLPDIAIGDYALVHVGFAISKIDEESARETLRTFEELDLLGRIQCLLALSFRVASAAGQEEVPAILEILQRLKDARDRTMILVEHKMDMIMSLSDTIMVLQEGRLIADGEPEEIYQSKAVQEAYLGGGTARD